MTSRTSPFVWAAWLLTAWRSSPSRRVRKNDLLACYSPVLGSGLVPDSFGLRFRPRRKCGFAALVRSTFRQLTARQRVERQALSDDRRSDEQKPVCVGHVAR